MKMGKGIPLNDQVTFAVTDAPARGHGWGSRSTWRGRVPTHGDPCTVLQSQAHRVLCVSALTLNLSFNAESGAVPPCQDTLLQAFNLQNDKMQAGPQTCAFILSPQCHCHQTHVRPKVTVIIANSNPALWKFPISGSKPST